MQKMIMAIIPHDHANAVLNALNQAQHTATFTESRGGMLRQAQQMLFIAVEDAALETVLAIIRENCRTPAPAGHSAGPGQREPVTARLGGAVVFVWDIARFETY